MTPLGLGSGDLVTFGVSGLDDRMRTIAYTAWRSIADPFTAQWVSLVTRDLPPRSDMAEISRVFNVLHACARYQFHPRGTDRFQTLERTLTMAMAVRPDDPDLLSKWWAAYQRGIKTGAGDCDCGTVASVSALHTLGFQVGGRIVSSTGAQWEHIYALVNPLRNHDNQDTSRWMPLDLTIGPDGTPASATPGFELPLETMACYRDFIFDLSL